MPFEKLYRSGALERGWQPVYETVIRYLVNYGSISPIGASRNRELLNDVEASIPADFVEEGIKIHGTKAKAVLVATVGGLGRLALAGVLHTPGGTKKYGGRKYAPLEIHPSWKFKLKQRFSKN